jgi:hypothetical protein
VNNASVPTGTDICTISESLRFYVIVPETVQCDPFESHPMVAGCLMAQSFHIGRVVESRRALHGIAHEDVTTIVLSVRNTLELDKVYHELELKRLADSVDGNDLLPLSIYQDHNPKTYKVDDRVMTAICIGPVLPSAVRAQIGHLDLY